MFDSEFPGSPNQAPARATMNEMTEARARELVDKKPRSGYEALEQTEAKGFLAGLAVGEERRKALLSVLEEIEVRTRTDGDMADHAVNWRIKNFLAKEKEAERG
jgi:hypothetical protein